MCEEGSYRSMI